MAKVERDGEHTVPVDATAARVTSPGPSWNDLEDLPEGPNNLGRVRPRTRSWPRQLCDQKKQKYQWLGRCDCGVYVCREGGKWMKTEEVEGFPQMCAICVRVAVMKLRAKKPFRLRRPLLYPPPGHSA